MGSKETSRYLDTHGVTFWSRSRGQVWLAGDLGLTTRHSPHGRAWPPCPRLTGAQPPPAQEGLEEDHLVWEILLVDWMRT